MSKAKDMDMVNRKYQCYWTGFMFLYIFCVLPTSQNGAVMNVAAYVILSIHNVIETSHSVM